MTNKDIYKAALSLIAEPIDEEKTEDYLQRAPYILGNFFYENGELDTSYRKFTGLPKRSFVNAVFVPLEDEFPFAERFISSAEYYLASMLVVDEDTELSDKFFDLFSSSMSAIMLEVPAIQEKIADMY